MTYKRNKIYGIIVGLILAIGLGVPVYGQVFRPPSASLAPGDITSNLILNGTIVNLDISATAAIDASKINGGLPAGGILLSNGTQIATSSLLNYATSTGLFGIGTTTPSQVLSVHGGGLFAGSVSVAGLTATGTTRFGGVAYTWPSADGSNLSALTTNGAGTLSWSNPSATAITRSLTAGASIGNNDAVSATAPISVNNTRSGTCTTCTSLTYAHTVAGNLLFVNVVADNNTIAISGVTYAGTSMLQLSNLTQTGLQENLFVLVNPTKGVNNVVVTAASASNIDAVSVDYFWARTAGAPNIITNGTCLSCTALSTTATPNLDGSWGIAAVAALTGTISGTGTSTLRILGTNRAAILDTNAEVATTSNATLNAASTLSTTMQQTVVTFGPKGGGRAMPTIVTDVDLEPAFMGFATSAAGTSTAFTATVGGVHSGFTNLVTGSKYYLSTTTASISTTSATTVHIVGIAATSTAINISNQL